MTDRDYPLSSGQKHIQELQLAPEDEVSLLDLFSVLYQQKNTIFIITLIFTLVATSYILWVKPIYRVRTSFIQPKGIVAPEGILSTLITDTNESIYKHFLTRIQSFKDQQEVLESKDFFERFFNDATKSSPSDKLALKIHESIILRKDPQRVETTYAQMDGPKPEVIADFLASLSETTINNLQTEFAYLLQSKIANRITNLSSELKNIQIGREREKLNKSQEINVLNTQRKKRINYLSEQLAIAKKLNIKKHHFTSTSNSLPLWYLYGEFFLREEISVLKSFLETNSQPTTNSSDKDLARNPPPTENGQEIDINNLPKSKKEIELESQINKLKAIDVSLVKPEVAIITQPSIAPETPIKPNKIKIFLLGIIMGLSTGIIVAFIINLIANLKKRKDPAIHSAGEV